ncbi:MAG: F0F1 ATP synthase subunit alpha [Candidatus Omnitrophota bacterium]
MQDKNIATLDIREIGLVEEVRQGIIKIKGFPSCLYGQEIEFQSGAKGMVVEFNPEWVFAIVFGNEYDVRIGETVSSVGKPLFVPVGDNFIGRVVNCIARPLDGKKPVEASDEFPVFREAEGVMKREPIDQPLATGIKILDLVIPLGKGQRELILGDRQIGKSSIGLDTIINQKGKDVICIYCWVGGNHGALQKTINLLNQHGAMEYTLFVCASAGASSAEQYLAPYTAAALGEYFMYRGKDVLVIFDDLTKQAWAYRQMSLLMERAPGREAYPGDIFFLHSQLMERAGRLKKEFGGGSMTFLPICETLQGDITGYIPSNLVSITDGQIYMNTGLFQEGFKPAIDLELSVSRIGSKVQCPAIRDISKGLRYEYVRYRSLLRLTRLRTKLSAEATQQLQRGKALYELLVQDNSAPLSLVEEVLLFYAFERKILEVVSQQQLKKFKNEIYKFILDRKPTLAEEIERTGELTDGAKTELDQAFRDYFQSIGIS